jgi:hypothetical protein
MKRKFAALMLTACAPAQLPTAVPPTGPVPACTAAYMTAPADAMPHIRNQGVHRLNECINVAIALRQHDRDPSPGRWENVMAAVRRAQAVGAGPRVLDVAREFNGQCAAGDCGGGIDGGAGTAVQHIDVTVHQ